jgi:hypothetical protein
MNKNYYAILMAGVFFVFAAISVVKVYDPTANK